MAIKYGNSYAIIVTFSLLLAGCGRESEIYTYTEAVVDPVKASKTSMPDLPAELMQASSTGLRWTAPDSWIEDGGHPMRIASFRTADGADVSIIMLPGSAGGLEANIRRWMGQIGLTVPEDIFQRKTQALPTIRTEGGWQGQVIDFNDWMNAPQASTPSMMAVLLDINGETGFVKMSGSYAVLEKERQAFWDFVRSLRE